MKSYGVTIQMKATEQYFPVVLFIMLYKVVLTFESVDEILWCDHSNESSLPVLSHDAICFTQFWKMKFWNLVETCLWPHLTVKGLTTLYFLQQSFTICNNMICCTEGSNMGGKRRNIAIQPVLQQCCKTSYTLLLLPALLYLQLGCTCMFLPYLQASQYIVTGI